MELFVTPPRSSENTLSGSVTTTFFHEQPLTRLSPADKTKVPAGPIEIRGVKPLVSLKSYAERQRLFDELKTKYELYGTTSSGMARA